MSCLQRTNSLEIQQRFEIIVIGHRSYWQTMERTIESLVSMNKHSIRINVGLNSPEPEMLIMLKKYRSRLNLIEVSGNNLNKVGMQRRLVNLCSAQYIISFDHDSYVVSDTWQDCLIQRIEAYENREMRYFGDFGPEREAQFLEKTGNKVGMLGLIMYDLLDVSRRGFISKCAWHDSAKKVNHGTIHESTGKELVWFCAGAFYVFLREPYNCFNYPGCNLKMLHEDVILSYYFQHHGYRLGDLVAGFEDCGIDTQNAYTALGKRVIVNAGHRTWDPATTETEDYS